MKESKELTSILQGFFIWFLLVTLTLIIWGLLAVIFHYFFSDSLPVMWYLLGAGLLSVGIVAVSARFIKK